MSTFAREGDCTRFPIRDYDQLEADLNAVRNLLKTLEPRHAAMTADLERITRPRQQVAGRILRTPQRGFEYRGSFAAHPSCIAIHVNLLRCLWTEFPYRRDEMAAALSSSGRSRSYVARNREGLFHGQPSVWALRHSRPLLDGWYVDTNMNPLQMQKILKVVVAVAGLKWGEDVRVFWRPTVVPACSV
jgi:hypothetical protein